MTTLVGTDTDDGPDDTTLTTGSFYAGPDNDWGTVSECDPFFQDCPEGEKCVPYASTGGTWDANKCVAVTGDGAPGDPCVYGGVIEATDDCDGSGICWNTQVIDGQTVGICTAFCTGTADSPQCNEGEACLIGNEGTINLCIPSCDPNTNECPDEYQCTWVNDSFACVPAGQNPGGVGEPCSMLNDCPSGSACVLAEVLAGCEDTACCAAYCSLSMPMCMEPFTECISFFEGRPPAGFEDVGICVSP